MADGSTLTPTSRVATTTRSLSTSNSSPVLGGEVAEDEAG
jgi:hypothetical protein